MPELLERDWNRLPEGYRRSYAFIDGQGVYWHLYHRDDRVNGGLADEEDHARRESRRCAWAHYWSQQPLRRPGDRYRWDWDARWDGE